MASEVSITNNPAELTQQKYVWNQGPKKEGNGTRGGGEEEQGGGGAGQEGGDGEAGGGGREHDG